MPFIALILWVLILLFFTKAVLAGNGLNMIGYGAESISMGGADIAVARDTSAINTNPAGLTDIPIKEIEFNTAAAFALDVRHKDSLGNDESVANSPIGWGELGYAQPLTSHPVTFGIGLFAQGGAGYDYHNLITPFGTRDEFSSLLRIAKLDIGSALMVNSRSSIGVSLTALYADLNQKIFPNTSIFNPGIPEQSFYGFELDGQQGMHIGYKLGVKLKVTDLITLGVVYTSKISLDMQGGRYISNLSATGLGKVNYRDVSVTGMNLPQELGLGAAMQADPALLVAVEVKWIDWSSALTTSTLTATNPDNPAAPAVQTLTSSMNWRNQIVMALGIAYKWSDDVVFRGGYNYGRDPIPDNNLNPLLAAISRQTITAGVGYRLTAKWQMDGGIEYSPKESIHYSNPSLPFGPDAEEVNEVLALHLRITYRI